jgi:glycosyltransferase involved in cell wall biosynthesis
MAPCFALIAYYVRHHNIPIIFLSHNVLPHEAHSYDRTLARLALHQPQAFIVQAPQEKERLIQLIPGARVWVCPHPIYSMFNPSAISHDAAQQRLNLPTHLPVVLFFGIVRPYKGLKVLLKAVARLRDQGQPVFLLVAGEFWEDRTYYDDLVIQLRLDALVRFDDRYIPNEEVPLLFSASDLFAAPYIQTTQSGAVMMAKGFGTPMVVSAVVAKESGLVETENCKIVPIEDDQSLAEAICALLVEPPVRRFIPPSEDGWNDLVTTIENAVGELRPEISTLRGS